MKRVKRAVLFIAVAFGVVAAGCGQTHMGRKRKEAQERWALSRAEMATRLAGGCFRRGELGRARQHVEEGVKTGAPHAPMFILAARLAAENGELDTAHRYAETARAIEPESAEACYVLGTVEQTLGHADRALAAFCEAVRLEPQRPAYVLAEVELLTSQGQAEQALQRLDEAIGRMPGRPEVHAACGDLLCLADRHEEAAGAYRIALRLDPKQKGLTERLATALFFSGAFAEAEPILADLAAESESKVALGWILGMRGDCLLALERIAEARALYGEAVESDPASVQARVGLAKCDVLEDRLASARKQLEAALKQAPRHAEANALMGFLLIADSRPGEAVPHLRLALKARDCPDREVIERLLALATGRPMLPPEDSDQAFPKQAPPWPDTWNDADRFPS